MVKMSSSLSEIISGKVVQMMMSGNIDQARCYDHLKFIDTKKDLINGCLYHAVVAAAGRVAEIDKLPPTDPASPKMRMDGLIADLILFDDLISFMEEKPSSD